MRRKIGLEHAVLFFLLLLGCRALIWHGEYRCHEVQVLDGDTVKCVNPVMKKLRIAAIDAPELSQTSFEGTLIGAQSKEALIALIDHLEIKVVVEGQDMYGRDLGRIYLKDKDLGLELVKSGHAYLYPLAKFWNLKDKGVYERAYLSARWKRLGIWGTQGSFAPWTYRKKMKELKRLTEK